MRLVLRVKKLHIILYYKERECGEDYQESEIERAEKSYIGERFALCVRGVLTERNKACK